MSGGKRRPSVPAPGVACSSHTHLIVYSTLICSFRAFQREGGQVGEGQPGVYRSHIDSVHIARQPQACMHAWDKQSLPRCLPAQRCQAAWSKQRQHCLAGSPASAWFWKVEERAKEAFPPSAPPVVWAVEASTGATCGQGIAGGKGISGAAPIGKGLHGAAPTWPFAGQAWSSSNLGRVLVVAAAGGGGARCPPPAAAADATLAARPSQSNARGHPPQQSAPPQRA
jgi:hypothetical protein